MPLSNASTEIVLGEDKKIHKKAAFKCGITYLRAHIIFPLKFHKYKNVKNYFLHSCTRALTSKIHMGTGSVFIL
jgi:hypothetical protein